LKLSIPREARTKKAKEVRESLSPNGPLPLTPPLPSPIQSPPSL